MKITRQNLSDTPDKWRWAIEKMLELPDPAEIIFEHNILGDVVMGWKICVGSEIYSDAVCLSKYRYPVIGHGPPEWMPDDPDDALSEWSRRVHPIYGPPVLVEQSPENIDEFVRESSQFIVSKLAALDNS